MKVLSDTTFLLRKRSVSQERSGLQKVKLSLCTPLRHMGGIEVMTSSTFNVSTKTEVDIQPHASAAVLLKEITSILH